MPKTATLEPSRSKQQLVKLNKLQKIANNNQSVCSVVCTCSSLALWTLCALPSERLRVQCCFKQLSTFDQQPLIQVLWNLTRQSTAFTILFSAPTLLVGRQEGIRPVKRSALVCWWWWFDWRCARFIAPIKTRVETFWYRLTQVHLENGR